MRSRLISALLVLLAAPAFAETRTVEIAPVFELAQAKGAPKEEAAPRAEPLRDLSRLTDKARQTRQRILDAAKTGDIKKVAAVMQQNEMMPVFSFGGDKDPVAFWQSSYPDSDGIEALAILIEILEMPFVHVDKGTAQEMFVWPYFYAIPLKSLTPEQKVELFRLVTGTDWREMSDFGAYIFFRVGISPDGVWHFFVAGD